MPRAKTRDSKSAAQSKEASSANIMDYYFPATPKDYTGPRNGSHCPEEAAGGPAEDVKAPVTTITKVKLQRQLAPFRTSSEKQSEKAKQAEKAPPNSSSYSEQEAGNRCEPLASGRPAAVATVKWEPEVTPLPAALAEYPQAQSTASAAAKVPVTAASCIDHSTVEPAERSVSEPPWQMVAGKKKNKSGPSKTGGPSKAGGASKTGDTRRMPNRLVTDFFPVRRSDRTTAKEQKDAAAEALRRKIEAGCEDGLKETDSNHWLPYAASRAVRALIMVMLSLWVFIKHALIWFSRQAQQVVTFPVKGRGVVAVKPFQRGDFVVEYAGELIDQQAAGPRDKEYEQNRSGSYMYYFSYKSKRYCVDATAESGRLGRLLNHSKQGNCTTKLIEVNGIPRLIIVAARNIEPGEELLYDYGDRSKASLELHPWLKA